MNWPLHRGHRIDSDHRKWSGRRAILQPIVLDHDFFITVFGTARIMRFHEASGGMKVSPEEWIVWFRTNFSVDRVFVIEWWIGAKNFLRGMTSWHTWHDHKILLCFPTKHTVMLLFEQCIKSYNTCIDLNFLFLQIFTWNRSSSQKKVMKRSFRAIDLKLSSSQSLGIFSMFG